MNIWSPDKLEEHEPSVHFHVGGDDLMMDWLAGDCKMWSEQSPERASIYTTILDFYRRLLKAIDLFIDRGQITPLRIVLIEYAEQLSRWKASYPGRSHSS
ncbi:MAG TPA: hypothetical protein PLJ35_15795 [Anaerolineae bacterium]|nr:hypothetical protein [Anaerolineae bacterium]HOR00274.1 hypothetical protein [Anaerolineae bacterium]